MAKQIKSYGKRNQGFQKAYSSKYKNKKEVVDGITFDSKKEADHYRKLRVLEQSGAIQNLECQKRFRIDINGQKICDYIADFVFIDGDKVVKANLSRGGNLLIVQDVKSEFTKKLPVYRLKKKLMKAVLGITIQEV